MEELKQRLRKELQQDFNVKIMATKSWGLPVRTIEIDYETVKRTKMDILMKMILIAFQKAEIETAEELSAILLVEQLFITDLIEKMTRSGLLKKAGSFFALTDVGIQQLEAGIYEHEPEAGTKQAIYSPHHQLFLSGDLKNSPFVAEEVYRYQTEFADWVITLLEESAIVSALQAMDVESGEGNVQTVVSEITGTSEIQIETIPCVEFHLYNAEADLLYARVWNTLSAQWDETLETELNDKERKKWREIYV